MSNQFPPESYGTHLSNSLVVELGHADIFPSVTPLVVPASGVVQSALILTHDFSCVTFGFSAAGALTCSIETFLDEEGTIPLATYTSSSGTTGFAFINDPSANPQFKAIKLSLANAGGSQVAVSSVMALVKTIA